MRSETVVITPSAARLMLSHSQTRNRGLSGGLVKRLVHDMKNGNWKLTADGISLDKDKNILNGHHRLYAITEADTPILMRVTYDVDPETFSVYDTGKNRVGRDVLTIRGLEPRTAKITAAAVPYIISWEKNKTLQKSIDGKVAGSATHIILAFYEQNLDVIKSTRYIQTMPRRAALLRESVSCFLHYEITKLAGRPVADRYIKLVLTGDGLTADNIVYDLRRRLMYHITKAKILDDALIIKFAIHTYKLWCKNTNYKDPSQPLNKIGLDTPVDFI